MHTSSADRLMTVLPRWRGLLQTWAKSERFADAVRAALNLNSAPLFLKQLTNRLSIANWEDLPVVRLLDASAMNGYLGGYSSRKSTIYLNASWLETADERAVLAVLTEELGHHLDARLNVSDTPGDEGALLAALLLGNGLTPEQRSQLQVENDWGVVSVDGTLLRKL